MITMNVCVDEKTYLTRVQRLDRSINFIGQRCKLIINHEGAVFSGEHSNVTAGTFQHVEMFRNFYSANLYGIQIWLCQQWN